MHHEMIASPAVKLIVAYAYDIGEDMQGLEVFDSCGVDEPEYSWPQPLRAVILERWRVKQLLTDC